MNTLFQSGWRPAYGWVGLSVVLLQLIIFPIVTVISTALGEPIEVTTDVPALTALLTSVIAIAGMRSYDKLNGTDTRGR